MSFFDKNYQTPSWYKTKVSRRSILKSAAGASAIVAMPSIAFSGGKTSVNLAQEPWLTLDAVVNHLLPSSNSGPGAKELQITQYLYLLIKTQPIDDAEKTFIQNGVGWLNGYSQSQTQQDFAQLDNDTKETMLRAISNSEAGYNWINTLINYIYEASLSAPSYGGNPNGIGWQWLEHKAGFPLPPKGKRYFELPGSHRISVSQVTKEESTKS
ncbi:gluconate 2-dehydrogenase subunit 3 family protein [Thalassotalea sp. LPB0316]|uniref:gluconate 2-dehydrogenase subunit 3 family protein n=1 Tax=Thalassotalea sp. LPB0316 TaxID=2769490 RepID=UPI0018683361|nr:gluconate 2-dehydrogenase subunit 3 family protein [Thalassotalea sp. LPB0316]QOL26222.1 gluconate 2-dehydrogenase subunit 3 family protein [Thalassotalea sp. LPB0316]